jgi:hypothetical protein
MTTPEPDLRNQRIAELAHAIWESEGRPEGQSARHWSIAERLVDAEERAAHALDGQPPAGPGEAPGGPQ